MIEERNSSDLGYLQTKRWLRSVPTSLQPIEENRARPPCSFFCVRLENLQKIDLKELQWELNSREQQHTRFAGGWGFNSITRQI